MNGPLVFWLISSATPTRLLCAAWGDAAGGTCAMFTGTGSVGTGLLAAVSVAAAIGLIWQWRSRRSWERRAMALAAAEVRLRRVIDGATDGIVLTDGETGIILQANRAVAELLGLSQGEMVGRHHTSFYPPEKREEMERRFCARLLRGGLGVAEVWVYRGSGELIPVGLHATPIELDGRRQMQATVLDLRQEHVAQAALRESEARFRTLFENSPVAVLEKDYTQVVAWLERLRAGGTVDLRGYLQDHPEVLTAQFAGGPVTAANRTALQRLGLPDVATYNRVMAERIPPAVLRSFQRELEALWEGRTTMTCALDYPRSEGRMGHSLLHWSVPLPDGQPDWRRALLVFTDLTELRTAEERLRASEEQSRLALRGFNIGIWEYNFATNESFFSERWKQMLGFGPHEIGGRREEWLARVHPEDQAAVTAALEAHLHGQTAYYETEHRLRSKDNRYIWVHSRGEAVFDEQGNPVRIVGAHADISERKQAEEARRASEERYRRLFENNPSPMYVYDWETRRFLMVNEAAVTLYGYGREEFAEMTVFDLCPPGEAGRLQSALAGWQGATVERGIWQYRRKDGTIMFMDVSADAYEYGGRPAVLVLTQDVTQRHLAELRYRELFENALEGVYESTIEGAFRTVNPALARMLGYASPSELLAADLHAGRNLYVRPGRRAEFLSLLGTSDAMKDFESEVRRRDGSTIWVSENVRAVRDAEGQLLCFHGFVTDVTARRRAAEALRASEERLRQIVQQADCMLWQARVTENAGGVEWKFHVPASGLHRRIFGHEYQAETELYQPEHIPGRPEMDARCAAALRGGAPGYQQEFQVFANGREFWLAEKVEITPVAPGVWSLVGVAVDVTARRQAEAALRASEARFRELVEHSPLAIADYNITAIVAWLGQLRAAGVTDLAAYVQAHPDEYRAQLQTSVVSGVNREAVRLLRASSKEHLLAEAAATFTAETLKMRWKTLLTVWGGRNESEGETTFRAFDGTEVRTFYHWWVPTMDGRPDYARSQMLLVDLSDIKRAEDALATERERLRVTLRAMTEGVITVDLAGTVQFINEAAEKLTGWTATTAVGRRIEEVCALRHEKSRAVVTLPASAELAAARVADLPAQSALISREASLVLVEGRVAAMHGAEGAQVGAVLVLRDITERARLEAEVQRSTKLESLGILAGGIAHDFNNLLTVVMGNLTLAMLDSQVAATAGRWLREAERGALRARDLTQQLLTFAKGGDPVRTAVALPDIVREAAQFVLHGSKVRCMFDIAGDLWPANVDKGQIGQVVQNIVINAVQAMPEGGALHVALRNAAVAAGELPALAAGHYLKLSLADTGTGIRSEHLTRIFDPYFTTKQQGSGLGLATVYSVVKKHQGHIEVESELGRGTTFRIWLPAAQRAPEVIAPVRTRLAHRTGRILFMDDEEPICELATALLQRMGYEAKVVNDGSEVVREYGAARTAGRPYDAVILDLTVPGGMGGLEAMEALRKLDPEVRAIVSSGYSSDPVLANYRANGFLGMVAKPYKITDLAKTIQTVLGNGRA